MHIFVDESGAFTIPALPKPSISVAGALVLPSDKHSAICNEFLTLSANWPKENGEIKGRGLNEAQIEATLALLGNHRALFDATAIDLGLHNLNEIKSHQEAQINQITKNLTPKHHPNSVAHLKRLQSSLGSLSIPSYIQLIVLTQLFDQIFRKIMLCLPYRAPEELASFHWVIDRKANSNTRTLMETLWDSLFLPFLESKSLRDPLVQVIGADYSHLPAAYAQEFPRPPAHLAPHATSWIAGKVFRSFDMKAIMKDRSFANSADQIGLQLVDVAVSAVRRGMSGHLKSQGWLGLAKILIRPPTDEEIVNMVCMGSPRRWQPHPPYLAFLKALRPLASLPDPII